MSDSFIERARSATVQTCDVCHGVAPCDGCKRNAQRPGTSTNGNHVEVVLPVGETGEPRIRQMLRDRGHDPDEWRIKQLVLNEWEGQRTKDRGKILLTQTKAVLERIVPDIETPWFRFVEAIRNVGTSNPVVARKRLKPSPGPARYVLMGDDQAPFINQPLHDTALEFLRDIQPAGIIYMGDGADFPTISKHAPKRDEFIATVQEAIDAVHTVLRDRLDAAGPQCVDNSYLLGNHDIRLEKAIMDRLPEILGLKRANASASDAEVLSIRNLMRLDSLGFTTVTDPMGDYPHGTITVAAGNDTQPALLASHGWLARKGAGASARGSVEHLNAGLAVGHTHRHSVSYITRWTSHGTAQIYTTIETGTMADPRGLGYTRYPDWQPGFVVVEVWPDGTHHADTVTFNGDVLSWRDRSWQRTPRGIRAS